MEILSERELLNLTGGHPLTLCEELVQDANQAQDWTDQQWDEWGEKFENCA